MFRQWLIKWSIDRMTNDKSAPKGLVRLSVGFGIVGVIGTIFFSVLMVFLVREAWLLGLLGMGGFVLLSLAILNAYGACRVFYDNEGFRVRSFFWRSRRYTYRELDGKEKHGGDVIYHMGKHRLCLEAVHVGRREFGALAEKNYTRLCGGNEIPLLPRATNDIFKGHSSDKGVSFIVTAVLVWGIVIGILIGIFFMLAPTKETDTELYETRARDIFYDDRYLVFFGEDGCLFKFKYGKELSDHELSRMQNESLTLRGVFFTPDQGEPYVSVYSIEAAGDEIFGLADYDRAGRLEAIPLIILVGVMALAWLIVCVLSVIVGRNPEKYSPKLIHALFAKGYIQVEAERK